MQYVELDSNGNPPLFPTGTKVFVGPCKMEGVVKEQLLHFDYGERFWGNLIVDLEDGSQIECHCWQTDKV